MRIRPGILIAVAVLFLVLFVARYFEWGSSKPGAASGDGGASQGNGETPGSDFVMPTLPPNAPPTNSTKTGGTGTGPIPLVSRVAAPEPTPGAPETIPQWERTIDEILTGQGNEDQKAKRLLELFPKLPEEGKVEAAQHLSNLLADEEYSALGNTLTNAATSEEVLDILLTDVLNRPNAIKLPTLLDIARTPGHPKAEEAREVLEVYIEEECGTDWNCWQAAVTKWLKENPEE